MTCSPARMAANRANALRSTGPRTAEGKEASRRNAVKHGLAGAGVALPTEDEAEVSRRFEAFEAELGPKGELARVLVRRAALHSVRMERCARHEAAMLSEAIRHAPARFDEARAAEVAALADRLASEPEASARGLRATPEGIAWMLGRWEALRRVLNVCKYELWGRDHARIAENLMGRRLDEVGTSRVRALSDAVGWVFTSLDDADGAGLDRKDRREWARTALDALIGSEIDGLRRALEAIDPEAEALDRAEAADRALFDPSPRATLARRYEAAAERGLYRALRALGEHAAMDAEVGPAGIREGSDAASEPIPPEPLGSSRPEPDAAPAPMPSPAPAVDRPVPLAAAPLGSIGRASDSRRGWESGRSESGMEGHAMPSLLRAASPAGPGRFVAASPA